MEGIETGRGVVGVGGEGEGEPLAKALLVERVVGLETFLEWVVLTTFSSGFSSDDDSTSVISMSAESWGDGECTDGEGDDKSKSSDTKTSGDDISLRDGLRVRREVLRRAGTEGSGEGIEEAVVSAPDDEVLEDDAGLMGRGTAASSGSGFEATTLDSPSRSSGGGGEDDGRL